MMCVWWSLVTVLILLSTSTATLAQPGLSSMLSFCYVTYNTLPSSPFLYWSFLTQGTLNITTNSSGTIATDARGTRIGYSAANGSTTTSIGGVAAAGSYLGNTNLVSTATSSALLSGSSILVFVTTSPAPFATGFLVSAQSSAGLTYVAVGSGGELDNPPNDGETSVVTTLWQTAPALNGLSANFSNCTLSVPSTVLNSAANTSLYNSNGAASQFCMDLSGGPGEGTSDGGAWNILSSGTLKTSGWVGTTVSGRSASVVTAVTGTRSFVYENGTTITTALSLAPFTAPLSAISNPAVPYVSSVANNVLYLGWPQLDAYGWALQSSEYLTIQSLANTQTNVVRLSISTTEELIETILAGPNGMAYLDRTGTFLWQSSSNSSSLVTLVQQCSINYGTVSQYEFCYYIDNSAFPTSNPQRGLIYTYGLFTAAGPQPQHGRRALRVQKITGVRYIQRDAVSLVPQNLKHIKYIDQDGTLGQQTDNLIYTSAPALDSQGLLLETNGNAIFISGTSGNMDIRLFQGAYGISELDSDLITSTAAGNGTVSGFFYQPVPAAGSLGVTSQCSGFNSMFVPTPAINVYSFCYGQLTSQYNLTVAATLQLYSAPISFLNRLVYPIAGINGTRYFSSVSGNSSANAIIGPSSDWFAKQVNDRVDQQPHFHRSRSNVQYSFHPLLRCRCVHCEQINPGESYDQLFSLSNASQIVDAQGILYQIVGAAQTPRGPNYQLQVIRLYWNAASSLYMEEVEVGVVNGTWKYSEIPVSTAVIVNDGGASAANGTVSSAYCGVSNPPAAPSYPYASSSASTPIIISSTGSNSASSERSVDKRMMTVLAVVAAVLITAAAF